MCDGEIRGSVIVDTDCDKTRQAGQITFTGDSDESGLASETMPLISVQQTPNHSSLMPTILTRPAIQNKHALSQFFKIHCINLVPWTQSFQQDRTRQTQVRRVPEQLPAKRSQSRAHLFTQLGRVTFWLADPEDYYSNCYFKNMHTS